MHLTHSVKNQHADELEVWVEPWCHPYNVPRGSTLTFGYEASTEEAGRLDTELTPARLTLWFGSDYEPTALLDGKPIKPAWD